MMHRAERCTLGRGGSGEGRRCWGTVVGPEGAGRTSAAGGGILSRIAFVHRDTSAVILRGGDVADRDAQTTDAANCGDGAGWTGGDKNNGSTNQGFLIDIRFCPRCTVDSVVACRCMRCGFARGDASAAGAKKRDCLASDLCCTPSLLVKLLPPLPAPCSATPLLA